MRADLEYITGVLDELETLVQEASSVPMNRGKGMVGRSDALVLVQELRESLPAELEEAKGVQREYESIVAYGQEEAERVLGNARKSAEEIVAESETYRRAERRSAENLDRAERYSEEISRGAEGYREQVMTQVERWFADSLNSAAQARQELEVSHEVSPEKPGQTDETQPQERQDPFAADPEDAGQGWRASSA